MLSILDAIAAAAHDQRDAVLLRLISRRRRNEVMMDSSDECVGVERVTIFDPAFDRANPLEAVDAARSIAQRVLDDPSADEAALSARQVVDADRDVVAAALRQRTSLTGDAPSPIVDDRQARWGESSREASERTEALWEEGSRFVREMSAAVETNSEWSESDDASTAVSAELTRWTVRVRAAER